jgi:3-hydroxybutyrate dehydrogenase
VNADLDFVAVNDITDNKTLAHLLRYDSVHGKYASPFKAGYVSAKHGLIGLTRVIALETATFGITCNAICPGYVDTPLVRNELKDLAVTHKMTEEQVLAEVILGPVPQKKLVTPEEIGYLAAFLCSDAARGITAQAYTIDGGWIQM